jgi:hypothetical protein
MGKVGHCQEVLAFDHSALPGHAVIRNSEVLS